MTLLRTFLFCVAGLILTFILDYELSSLLFHRSFPTNSQSPDVAFLDEFVALILILVSLSWLALTCLLANLPPLNARVFGFLGAVYMPLSMFYLFAPSDMGRALDLKEWQYFKTPGVTMLVIFLWAQTAFGASAAAITLRRPK